MTSTLRTKLIRLAHENPALRADLRPLLKTAEGPSYKTYVEKKRKDGEKPLPEDEWETRVKGKGDAKGDAKDEGGESKPVALSREGYKAIGDLLGPFNEPGSMGHVVSFAVAGKPMEPKHVKKVVSEIDGYLKNWATEAKRSGWTPKDKKNLTRAKGILENSMGKTASTGVNYFREIGNVEKTYHQSVLANLKTSLQNEGATVSKQDFNGRTEGEYEGSPFKIDLFVSGTNGHRKYKYTWDHAGQSKRSELDWYEFDSFQMAAQIVYKHFVGFVQ